MNGLQFAILRSIQWRPKNKEKIHKQINRFRFRKIPFYLVSHTVDELETAGLIEEMSVAEVQKILAGEDPDDIEVVAENEFIGQYGLSGAAAFALVQDMKENNRRFYIPLLISVLSFLVSVLALFFG